MTEAISRGRAAVKALKNAASRGGTGMKMKAMKRTGSVKTRRSQADEVFVMKSEGLLCERVACGEGEGRNEGEKDPEVLHHFIV
ncbi:MAG: hypothetical protein MZV70_45045 [Desulfobacterales bacterium]|nr:hypothetical protein [Desulfobacterales bacterium]